MPPRPRQDDLSEIKTAADILKRASRPQRHSTYVPQKRDWRYEAGIFQHEDFDEEQLDQTIWDQLDEDYHSGRYVVGKGRSRRRRVEGEDGDSAETGVVTTRYFNRVLCGDELREEDGLADEWQPTALVLSIKYATTKANLHRLSMLDSKNNTRPVLSAITSRRDRTPTPLSISADIFSPPAFNPSTPATTLTLFSPAISTTSSASTVQTFPLFQRPWKDGTYDYDTRKLFQSLRDHDEQVQPLPENYTWFPDAVPVDACFPPGLVMTSKEIQAYYPHHIRWYSVARRMLNNGYRPEEMLGMQSFFRSSTSTLPHSTLIGHLPALSLSFTTPRPTTDLRTDGFISIPHMRHRGLTVPTFSDLTRGLVHLPTGLDARELTACIRWWLEHRDSFTPRLEFNVLHARSLVRALRISLKPFGTRNLDMIALEEWRERGGRFRKCCVQQLFKKGSETRGKSDLERKGKSAGRDVLEIHLGSEEVRPRVELKLRHVLMFPFLAIRNMIGEALEMGIENAEARKGRRKGARREEIERERHEDIQEGNRQGDTPQNEPRRRYEQGDDGAHNLNTGGRSKRQREEENTFEQSPAKRVKTAQNTTQPRNSPKRPSANALSNIPYQTKHSRSEDDTIEASPQKRAKNPPYEAQQGATQDNLEAVLNDVSTRQGRKRPREAHLQDLLLSEETPAKRAATRLKQVFQGLPHLSSEPQYRQ